LHIGAVIVKLTRMYITGLLIPIGGGLSAELERAAGYGKAPSQKALAGLPKAT
jgi:hypothetical protein